MPAQMSSCFNSSPFRPSLISKNRIRSLDRIIVVVFHVLKNEGLSVVLRFFTLTTERLNVNVLFVSRLLEVFELNFLMYENKNQQYLLVLQVK